VWEHGGCLESVQQEFFQRTMFCERKHRTIWNMQECCIFNMESLKLTNYQFGRSVEVASVLKYSSTFALHPGTVNESKRKYIFVHMKNKPMLY
jgi:hypothetical protein